jgi:hypothetical protein
MGKSSEEQCLIDEEVQLNNKAMKATIIRFKSELKTHMINVFQDQDINAVPMMFAVIDKLNSQLFEGAFFNNVQCFISVLFNMHPEILFAPKIMDEECEENNIYGLLKESFADILAIDCIKLGIEMGVFKEDENVIDLTPRATGH